MFGRSSVVTSTAALVLIGMLAATPAYAGTQQLWVGTRIGVGGCGTFAVSTAVDPGTGIVYAAYNDFECGASAPLLVAYSRAGTLKWTFEDLTHDEVPAAVTVDRATHTVVLASTRGGHEMLVRAFTGDNGHKLWGQGRSAGGSATFHTVGVVVDAHDRAVVTGTLTTAGVPTISAAAFKATTGTPLWHVHYDGHEHRGAFATGIGVDASLNRAYIVGGAFAGNSEDLATVAYGTANGVVAWAKETAPAAVPTGIAVDPGNHQIYSLTGKNNNAEADTYAYSSAGAERWHTVYSTGLFIPYRVALDTGNHQVYLAGISGAHVNTTIVAYASDGTRQWADTDKPVDSTVPRGLAADPTNHRVYVTSAVEGDQSTEHIVTFADSATGARKWHESYSLTGHHSTEPGALTVDPNGAQVYVAGYQDDLPDNRVDASVIAYQA